MFSHLLRSTALIVLATLLASFSARAYTPESGVWWNPNESGTGLILDLQDNFLAVSLFVGDTQGNPIWFTSTGFLQGNALYEGQLDFFPGAQCVGCGFRPVNPQLGVGGPIRIVFNPADSARATLTIGGRTTNIERFRFYFKRPEDEQQLPGVSGELTRLMGEWSATLDFSGTVEGPGSYRGDILIFDNLDFDAAGDFVDGCRPAESIGGFCDDDDLDERYAVGEYNPASGDHVIVVENSPTTFVAYFLELGTDKFEGEFSVYNRDTNPVNFFPTRGYRSASRTFVQEGVGPSSKSKVAFGPGLPLTVAGSQKSASKVSRTAEELQSLHAIRERLEAQLTARRTAQ